MTDRVLLVGADAERRGPTRSLLQLVSWLVEHLPDVGADVVLLAGGPLESEFRARLPTTVLDRCTPPPRPRGGVADRLLRARPGLAPWWDERQAASLAVASLRGLTDHGLVYVADARAIGVLRLLPPRHRRVVAHVHERDTSLRHLLRADDRRALVDRTDHLLAGSRLIRDDLLRTHGLGGSSVTTHEPMLEARAGRPPADPVRRRACREELGVAGGGLVVGAGGRGGWRDGFDLFVRVACEVRRTEAGPSASFLWAASGSAPADGALGRGEADGDPGVTILEGGPDLPTWLSLVDVLVVAARVDDIASPALEAGRAGLPFVCFDQGATADLARRGGGLVASYPSPFLLADALRTLLADQGRRQAVGARGAEWVRAHHDTTVRAPVLWEEIERWRP